MLPIKGVYEIAIRVKDLAARGGLLQGRAWPGRGFARRTAKLAFPVRGRQRGNGGVAGRQRRLAAQHFAFTVNEADIESAAAILKDKGVAVSEPVYHEWMNAVSLYFDDPDGHALELI